MSIPYELFTGAFLAKISEYEFIKLPDSNRTKIVDGYLKRTLGIVNHICGYDFLSKADDVIREFDIDVGEALEELVDIVSEGMVTQWLKPYVYHQENLQNAISTRDYSVYSPSELLMRIGNAYAKAQKDFTQMMREFSYNHGDLTDLHL